MTTNPRRDTGERVVVVDTETTGRSHENGDRIVEIGCVEVVGNMETGRTYHTYVNPGRHVEEEARAVHGLSDEFLADKPRFRAIHRELFEFIGDAPLVIHNAAFDVGFLNMERKLVGLPPIANEIRDTLRLAHLKWPGQRASLDALCSRLGVDNSGREIHGALLDASLLAQVYIKMMGLDRLDLGIEELPQKDAAATAAAAPRTRRPARPARPPLPPTPEEESAFRAFLPSIKGAIWQRIESFAG